MADDDAVIRSLISVTLSIAGFAVSQAEDGRAVLELLESATPDIVMLEAAMPRISGWEVALRLHADPRTAAIKVLLLTGHDPNGDSSNREPVGVDVCLSKPFDPEEMVAVVRQLSEVTRP